MRDTGQGNRAARIAPEPAHPDSGRQISDERGGTMAAWDQGYVTDVAYTTNFYRETTPVWLATTCLLLGQRPPDLSRPFRYADLGCGYGVTTLIVAATHPQAEVWGFDFNPAHVEWATRVASAAGLGNAHFVEASFADLAARAEAALPQFDFMVAHGVASWITDDNRRLMLDFIRQRLKPGGLVYLSYNVTTGWSGISPLRQLMWMLAEANPARSDLAVTGVLDFIGRMRQAGALFFQANPRVEARLEDMRRQDPRYIAHEYLNREWRPLMFADMAEAMRETRCNYVGSATLSENVDALAVPEGMLPLLSEAHDQVMHETLRDFASSQSFRRDIYRRGLAPLGAPEQTALLDELSIASMGITIPDPITFDTPVGKVTGRPEIYRPLFDLQAEGILSVHRARELPTFASRPLGELLQAIALMIGGGFARPVLRGGVTAAARQATQRLNRTIALENARGGELALLAAPLIGSALPADVLETLIVGDVIAGLPTDLPNLTRSLLSGLERSGRKVQRDGQPVSDPAEIRTVATDLVERFLNQRLPVLRTLGILDLAPESG